MMAMKLLAVADVYSLTDSTPVHLGYPRYKDAK